MPASQDMAKAARYSKRKRNQINYYEDISDVEGIDSEIESQDVDSYSEPKKQKSTRPARPLPKRKIFPFLQLPAEIRNMIYEECLTDPRGICLNTTIKYYRRTVARYLNFDDWLRYESPKSDDGTNVVTKKKPILRELVPAILVVNKQIHQEARDLLYSNEFKLDDPLALHSFLVDIGPQAARLLTHVTLRSWIYGRSMQKGYNHSAFAMLASATNIKKLRIEAFTRWREEPHWVARQLYRDGYPWLEAVGAAKGKLDAALDLLELCTPRLAGDEERGWGGDYEKDTEAFKAELSKLLGAHMRRMKVEPVKKTKKAKRNNSNDED